MTSQIRELSVASVIGQVVLYAALAAVLLLFASGPSYRQLGPDQALIKLSIVHEPQRVRVCAQRTPEELAKLPPNMRVPMDCPRERAPLAVEVDVDGHRVLSREALPSGLARDGRATLYHRLVTTAGRHDIAVRLRDRAGTEDFNIRAETSVDLRPSQNLIIDFESARREITFR